MFRSLFPFRRLLATTFLVVFVNVFVGQCWCATAKPTHGAGRALRGDETTKKLSHSCCSGKKGVAKEHSTQTGHSHKSGSHDCCKDKSASLLSSLDKPAQKHLFIPAPALLPAAAEFHFRLLADKWDRTGAVALVPPRHLKPKIPDIRIFIQSLTV